MVDAFTQMSNRKSTKQIITEAVLAQLPDKSNSEYNIPIDQLIFQWWKTGRQDGLRLTNTGDLVFRLAEIEYFVYPMERITDGSWYTFMLELNKKIKCPYYLGVNSNDGKKNSPFIRVYDSKIAVLISLYGNVKTYMDSVKVRK